MRCFLFLLSCMSLVSHAVADDMAVSVASGKRTAVASYGTYSTFECTAGGVPQFKIGRAPANGSIEVREERRVMNAGRCGRVSANVLIVYYTARKGFRGQDAAAVDFTSFAFAEGSETRTERITLSIDVR